MRLARQLGQYFLVRVLPCVVAAHVYLITKLQFATGENSIEKLCDEMFIENRISQTLKGLFLLLFSVKKQFVY